MNIKRYEVKYKDGSGIYYEDGIWEVKETPKTIRAEKIKEFMSGIYRRHDVGFKARIGKGTGNPMEKFDDGSFVVYFDQAGTPYMFDPIAS